MAKKNYKYEQVKNEMPVWEGTKAALTLLRLVEDMLKRGQLKLQGTAIEFSVPGGDEVRVVEFTPHEYVAFAMECCDDVSRGLFTAAEKQLREQSEDEGPDIQLPPSR